VKSIPILAAAVLVVTNVAMAADIVTPADGQAIVSPAGPSAIAVLEGRVSVVDGRTLRFPETGQSVRLADIDACELPQWALNPEWMDRDRIKSPAPVPCGSLAKAWLKRTIGSSTVECTPVAYDHDAMPLAFCTMDDQNLALEMLRVGWARVSSPYPADPDYLARQSQAMAARYGMWATYVLDMNEWRRKAIDSSVDRQPIADYNLLVERESEISPAFNDTPQNHPATTDR
jgi:endonuclease YncB( thermonuclease family)